MPYFKNEKTFRRYNLFKDFISLGTISLESLYYKILDGDNKSSF